MAPVPPSPASSDNAPLSTDGPTVDRPELPLLEVANVSKRFSRDLRQSLRYAVADIAHELFGRGGSPDQPMALRPGEFAALDDVSFKLFPGEAIAIVGRNGSGKSTLLKILYGLIKPDAGEVEDSRTVTALIELGTGFNEVLTGRENIVINAAMLGYVHGSIEQLTEKVIEFAELADVIDTPLRYYSSGMEARLAFSIAAHLDPDILLIDEVLATGDVSFQRKCAAHLAILAQGGSLVFFSHNGFQVQTVCQRAILLEEGRCTFAGSAVETVARYYRQLEGTDGILAPQNDLRRPHPVEVTGVRVTSEAARSTDCRRREDHRQIHEHCRGRGDLEFLNLVRRSVGLPHRSRQQ